MHYFSMVGIAIGLAMDAFAVSVTGGMGIGRVRLSYALRLSGCFGLFQAVMPCIGWLAGISFRSRLVQIDHWIAFVLLSIVGIKMIWESSKEKKESAGTPSQKTEWNYKMLLLLSVATSIDALAVGVTLAFTGDAALSAFLADAGLIGAVTFFLCLSGVYIGSRFGNLMKAKAEIFGGVLLVGMGCKILVEHLFFSA